MHYSGHGSSLTTPTQRLSQQRRSFVRNLVAADCDDPDAVKRSSRKFSRRRGSLDDQMMEDMGYEQELTRHLSELMCFAFGFTEVACLISVGLVFGSPGVVNGGPAVMIWGFVAACICTTIISFSMAEICAAYPSAGCVCTSTACAVFRG